MWKTSFLFNKSQTYCDENITRFWKLTHHYRLGCLSPVCCKLISVAHKIK